MNTSEGVRLYYPGFLASGSRSEVRQRGGTTWFRIPLNSFSPLGQLKGNDLTVLHLLVIEGKWEALHEFPFKKYIAHMAIVKANTANRSGPSLTNERETPPTYGELLPEQKQKELPKMCQREKTKITYYKDVCVLVPMLSSIFRLC